jgi:hypothetical protein
MASRTSEEQDQLHEAKITTPLRLQFNRKQRSYSGEQEQASDYYSISSSSDGEDEEKPIKPSTMTADSSYYYSSSPTSENFSGNASATTTTTRRERQWALALFSITTVLLFADQNLMSPNLTAMANDFGLDHEERDRKLGGDISLAFFLLGAPASFLVGFLADHSDRAKVFGWVVFIGELACFLTYFVTSYEQLYVCRAVTGFSVGGALPVIYSILGDMFAAEDRHVVSALVSFGVGAGISVGQAVAGYLGPTFGWRLVSLRL